MKRPGPDPEHDPPWTSGRFAVVDLEGNGQRPPELVELAAIQVDEGTPAACRTWLVRPERPITHHAVRVHGIRNGDVATAPSLDAVRRDICHTLAGRYLVAHHASVDWGVLHRQLPELVPEGVIDTLRLSRALRPGQPSYSLHELIGAFSLEESLAAVTSQRHRADYDAAAALSLLMYLMAPGDGSVMTLRELLSLSAIRSNDNKQQSLFDP